MYPQQCPFTKWRRAFLQKLPVSNLRPEVQSRNQAPFMKEVGIDIYGNGTQAMGDLLTGEESFDHVITVCDEANAE